ncbi:MAG: hypothetical protein FWE02_01855 [Defluviitaleaceae bacterium]|nr:hypothetical protein [Defluviitaleaceae bacterium]
MAAMANAREFQDIKKKKSPLPLIMTLVILVLIIGFVISVLVFNAFNIRERFLRGVLENIPVVNTLLDDAPNGSDVSTTESDLTIAEYRVMLNSLIDENMDLTNRNAGLLNQNNLLNERNSALEAEITTLLPFRDEFLPQLIAEDPDAFIVLFEAVNPEEAAEIYTDLMGYIVADQILQNYLNIFETMSARNTASRLSYMIADGQLNDVVFIISNLSLDRQAAVIAALEGPEAASILTRLFPE